MKIDATAKLYSEIQIDRRPLPQRYNLSNKSEVKPLPGHGGPHCPNPVITPYPPKTAQPNPVFIPIRPNPADPSHTLPSPGELLLPGVKNELIEIDDPVITPPRGSDACRLNEVV